jgi:hypothetical protein
MLALVQGGKGEPELRPGGSSLPGVKAQSSEHLIQKKGGGWGVSKEKQVWWLPRKSKAPILPNPVKTTLVVSRSQQALPLSFWGTLS